MRGFIFLGSLYPALPVRLRAPHLPRHSVELWPELPRRWFRLCHILSEGPERFSRRVRLRYQNVGPFSLRPQKRLAVVPAGTGDWSTVLESNQR